mmetsp:Transcript_155/g.592  ORF Transcript_155/g.592 Transcript_155/m.592 type:complete len:232 (-) Transcript_155:233-928(-)
MFPVATPTATRSLGPRQASTRRRSLRCCSRRRLLLLRVRRPRAAPSAAVEQRLLRRRPRPRRVVRRTEHVRQRAAQRRDAAAFGEPAWVRKGVTGQHECHKQPQGDSGGMPDEARLRQGELNEHEIHEDHPARWHFKEATEARPRVGHLAEGERSVHAKQHATVPHQAQALIRPHDAVRERVANNGEQHRRRPQKEAQRQSPDGPEAALHLSEERQHREAVAAEVQVVDMR